MDKITSKLLELEEARGCIERCQKQLKEEMIELKKQDKDFFEKEIIYSNNKQELQRINKQIEVLNDALDILENIG